MDAGKTLGPFSLWQLMLVVQESLFPSEKVLDCSVDRKAELWYACVISVRGRSKDYAFSRVEGELKLHYGHYDTRH